MHKSAVSLSRVACVRRSLLECRCSVCISRTPASIVYKRAFFSHMLVLRFCVAPERLCWACSAITVTQHSPRSLQHISRHTRPRSGASPAMDKQRSGEPSFLPAKRVRWDDSVLPDRTNTSGTASSNKAPPAPPSCSANDAIRLCSGKKRDRSISIAYIHPLSLCR